ncbi:hypothetical protein AAY473_024152 [Plecturocebus cupreus]
MSMGWVVEEWTILLSLNPKLASQSPVGLTCLRPTGFRLQFFSRELSPWYYELVMRKMCPVALALQWSSLDASSSSDSTLLFCRLFRDSGSRRSQLGSQTLRRSCRPHTQAHDATSGGFPTTSAKQRPRPSPWPAHRPPASAPPESPGPQLPHRSRVFTAWQSRRLWDMLLKNRFGPGADAHSYL